MIEVINGNILDATEKYIAHQTNCVSNGGAGGLAKSIFKKYPYADCYRLRTERSIPGTIDIRGNGINERFIINLHGQMYPGDAYVNHENDSYDMREKYFKQCLYEISLIDNIESIAFPMGIGCGLAGGNWEHYSKMLEDFADSLYQVHGVHVKIYNFEPSYLSHFTVQNEE